MIEITHADLYMIRYVLDHLREGDLLELIACDIDLDALPATIIRHKIFAFCASDDRAGPIAIWGMLPRRFGVGSGFAFGTDHWNKALLPMLRQIRGFILPLLIDIGYHRVEAAALARRHDVARFMALIGAKPEGVLKGYGIYAEDFISYRWLADEYCGSRTAQQTQDQHLTH